MSQLPGEATHTVGYALAAPSSMRPGDNPMRGLYPVCGKVERWLYVGKLETGAQVRASERSEKAFLQRLVGRERLAPLVSMFELARTEAEELSVNPLTYGNLAVLLNGRCEEEQEVARQYVGGAWAMVPGGASMRFSTQRVEVCGRDIPVIVLQPAERPWPPGTEMTWWYDAGSPLKAECIKCLCGAPFCSGWLVVHRAERKRKRRRKA